MKTIDLTCGDCMAGWNRVHECAAERYCDCTQTHLHCSHPRAVAVESSGEVVAHLCPTCDQQLSADWRAAR